MSNKKQVKFNIKNVYYAVAEEVGGKLTYGAPVPLPGAVSITLDPEGDSSPFYADGGIYYVAISNQGYSGSLELAMIHDEFRKDVLGEVEDESGHVLVEDANVEPKAFALMFQIDKSDGVPVLFDFYNCKAQRPSTSAETVSGTKEPNKDTLSFTASPTADGIVRTKTKDETPEALRRHWFENVWQPGDPLPEDGTMGALTVSSAAGGTTGTTKLTVAPALTSGNKYRVKTAAAVVAPVYDADCSGSGYQDWDGTADITAATGNKILVVECATDGKAKKAGVANVTAKA